MEWEGLKFFNFDIYFVFSSNILFTHGKLKRRVLILSFEKNSDTQFKVSKTMITSLNERYLQENNLFFYSYPLILHLVTLSSVSEVLKF